LPTFHEDIFALTRANPDFRREILTADHCQIVLMRVGAGEDIGKETHKVDQLLVFVDGEGEAELDGRTAPVKANDLFLVPAGTVHNFRNTGTEPLRLFTIYAPPEEEPGTRHQTRADSEAAHAGEG